VARAIQIVGGVSSTSLKTYVSIFFTNNKMSEATKRSEQGKQKKKEEKEGTPQLEMRCTTSPSPRANCHRPVRVRNVLERRLASALYVAVLRCRLNRYLTSFCFDVKKMQMLYF
jgi:hypothetical protein